MLRISGCGLSSWLFQLFFSFSLLLLLLWVDNFRRWRGWGQTMYYFHSSAIANMISSIAPSLSRKWKKWKKCLLLWCLLQFRQNIFHFSSIHILYYLKGIYISDIYLYIYIYIYSFHSFIELQKILLFKLQIFFLILYLYISTFSCVWCFYALSVTTVMKSGKFKPKFKYFFLYFLFYNFIFFLMYKYFPFNFHTWITKQQNPVLAKECNTYRSSASMIMFKEFSFNLLYFFSSYFFVLRSNNR